jgi:hypothetical protein
LGHDSASTLVAAILCALSGGAAPAGPTSAGDSRQAVYEIARHHIRLDVESSACWIVDRTRGTEEKRLKLDLRPPCYLLMWRRKPPTIDAQGISDGVAVGGPGAPMAFRYKVAGGTVAIAVIGDPPVRDPGPQSLYDSQVGQGYHCTDGMQGVRFRAARVQLLPKHSHGLFCLEEGLDEKEFWMIAHD